MRAIKRARIIGAPSGMAIRTRLQVSEQDELVLRALGTHLGSLAGKDLKTELAGASPTQRKRELTRESSSRWAGTIVRASGDLHRLARMGQMAHRAELRSGIGAIETRLTLPVGTKARIGRKTISGYRDGFEIFGKTARLQVLRARLKRVEGDLAAGRLHITRGSKGLLRARHNLEAADLSQESWSELWWAARNRISANGSADELSGNLTIRVGSDGSCSILLPASLVQMANSGKRYLLEAKVEFSYRLPEWRTQLASGRAISYDIAYEAVNRRWYLTASWAVKDLKVPAQGGDYTIGVDLNADHLACWVIDGSGNPVGRPISIPLALTGSAGHRDAQLRWAISQLLQFAKISNAGRIYIEDLGFSDGKSRESEATKSFRHLVSSFPTAKFQIRLQAMAARAGIELVAVDPAYTSKWSVGWRKPTSTKQQATIGHMAAAIGIGRRGLSLSLSRREGVTKRHQRMARGELPIRRDSSERPQEPEIGQRRPGPLPITAKAELEVPRAPKTVSGAPLISHCQC
jgi:IS605 OrfB family transposase